VILVKDPFCGGVVRGEKELERPPLDQVENDVAKSAADVNAWSVLTSVTSSATRR
jgi:hypothetical protein